MDEMKCVLKTTASLISAISEYFKDYFKKLVRRRTDLVNDY